MHVLQNHQWFRSKREFEIIKKYRMTNDRSILTDALRNLKKPSPEMLNAVAVIFDGNELIPHYKAAPRRKNEFIRNFDIALKVHHSSKESGRLKRDSGVDSPIEKVAKEIKLSYESVEKIYYSFAPVIKRLNSNSREVVDELVEMATAAFKDFDEVCLYQVQPFLDGKVSLTITPSKDGQRMAADTEE